MLQGQAVAAAAGTGTGTAAEAVAAAASGWRQTLHAASSKPESAAGRPAGWAAPPQHTPLSEMPERTRGYEI